MANFSSKFLGLIGAAMLFAGMSFGQTLVYTASTSPVQGIIIDRFEDTTALVGDQLLIANAANPALVAATVTVTLNEPITSQQYNVGKAGQTSEVILNVGTNATGTSNGVLYAGVVNGNVVTFTGVAIPAGAGGNLAVQNVRVNASLAPSGTSSFAVTETMVITTSGFLNYSNLGAPVQVGVVQTGFAVPTVSKVASYFICTANPAATAGGVISFSINGAQNFSGAFKVAANGGGQVTLADQGSNATAAAQAAAGGQATVGAATHGDRFQVAFSNIPAGVTIYLPTVVTGTALTGGGNLTLTATQSAAGAFKAVVAAPPAGSNLPVGVAPYVPGGNGTVSAWYEITVSDNVTANLAFSITGYITAPAAFSTAPTPAVTAVMTPTPTAGADIPTFANQNYPVLNLSPFNACATNLLFPFVSSAGFDTGIAISNTGTDPLGKAGAGAGAPGGCLLNFYGSTQGGATPGPTAAPFLSGAQLGVLPAPAAPNYTGTFLLSSVAPNFTGYIIAQCNFLYGHGFAYIDYGGLGAPTSTALGYLAQVLNPGRGAAEAVGGFEATGN